MKTNPGSTVFLHVVDMENNKKRFKRCYIAWAVCKQGWRDGCRPVIGLDGCHIKGQHPGQILTAIGIDANNSLYLIAYAVVEA